MTEVTIFAPTDRGVGLAAMFQLEVGNAELWTKPNSESLAEAIAQRWSVRAQLIFILPVGAVVRLIAPYLNHKQHDPGIVAVAETGRWVVSVSGGHQGGADALARQVAALLRVEPVITTASEGYHQPAMDLLGQPFGWRKGLGDWLAIASALLAQNPLQVVQTCGSTHWRSLLAHYSLYDSPDSPVSGLIWISDQLPPQSTEPVVCWHPRTLWIGVGCERGTPAHWIETHLRQVLINHNLAWEAIAGLASLDLKQDEEALMELAHRFDWPLRLYPAAELAQQPVPNPSATVAQAVGTPSVAEAAALKAAQAPLIVSKQIFSGVSGACTLAIARAQLEYSPRLGKLYLIGTGPGTLSQISPAAKAALSQCDVVVGYQLYLDLIQPLLHANQWPEPSPITQETQRAERAIALAQQGLTVGVVSSGDCGIYGMAGLVLECLAHRGWDGKIPAVEVFPGITALQAVAARVGAPLMHDFCAISLSDLLTPWSVIEQRLEAAAQADFVVALYNPRSRTRTQGLITALEIFQNYRSPQTPVAIARSVYRPDEILILSCLHKVDPEAVDMLSIVLIGNQSTFRHHQWLITPRGYTTSPKSD
jgi:cobalt-precorrin 5A hydrolase/precorrin-3B C17-methyltransferase